MPEAGAQRPPASRAMRSIERAFLYGVPGATEVVMVRHGDCYDGLDDTRDDPELSRAGREQARRLGERLRRVELDAVYSSPLRRALETARAIRHEVVVDPRLIEVETETGSGYVHVREQPEQVVARMSAAVADAVARHPGGRVVLVGHGVAILNYLADVMRVEQGRLRLLPYYTSLNVVRILGDRRMAGSLSDVAHLEGLPWLT